MLAFVHAWPFNKAEYTQGKKFLLHGIYRDIMGGPMGHDCFYELFF